MTRFPLFHAFSCSLLALASQSLGWQISGESVPAVPQEFRAAWISTVHNIDWPSRSGLSGAAQRAELLNILNTCAQLKLNAVFLQVRPNADALYRSSLEPWSQWLSGPGVNPGYDPLAFAIQEAHRRGIELHAWFNPFRAKANVKHAVGRNHISLTRPDLMKRNGSVLLMNPSASASRDHALKVIMDVVRRYDIDGVHLDDYFYPYPVAGIKIPDEQDYRANSNGIADINDWRRYNVNVFIKELGEHIHKIKPWVKFGVSPFGIYRNKRNDPNGSDTRGLQNYDDLFADVLMWVNNGWVDYCVPQLYWEIGNKAADYLTLIKWWNKNCSKRHLYIGESVDRTVRFADPENPNSNQMGRKFQLHQQLPNVKGTVLWYAKAVVDDQGRYGSMLRNTFWKKPALQPLMPYIDKTAPKKPKGLKPVWTSDGYILFWQQPKGKKWNDEATKHVVYRFAKGERIDLDNADAIQAITSQPFYKLPYDDGKTKYTYVVTSLNRITNESKGAKKKVKL